MTLASHRLSMIPVLLLLATTTLMPQAAGCLAVLAVILLLGVPHGALDGEIARPFMQPAFGWAWFPIFALPYLGLSACVLVAWRFAPFTTLAGFLAASVWHFGMEDAGPHPLEALVRGGLPIALPVLIHPAATAHLLGLVALHPLAEPPGWLVAGCCGWVLAALLWTGRSLARRRSSALIEPACLVLLFAALPPLAGFAAYFVCFHAPRHMAALVQDVRAPRVRTLADALRRSVPVTALTLLIGAGLWRWFPGDAPDRLLALTIEGLAALTLPHMLLDVLTGWWVVREAAPRQRRPAPDRARVAAASP